MQYMSSRHYCQRQWYPPWPAFLHTTHRVLCVPDSSLLTTSCTVPCLLSQSPDLTEKNVKSVISDLTEKNGQWGIGEVEGKGGRVSPDLSVLGDSEV